MAIRTCGYCDKKGLPILLARYGIAPDKGFYFPAPPFGTLADGVAPKVARSIGEPKIGLGGKAHYTVRILRGGYVYVYYEKIHLWEIYAVDTGGHLAKVLTVPHGTKAKFDTAPAPVEPLHQTCRKDMQKVANALMVTIPAPQDAGKVWFGFSYAWWTSGVRQNIEKSQEDARKHHMRCIDISTWYNGNKPTHAPQHTGPVTQVGSIMADFAMNCWERDLLFTWNPYLVAGVETPAAKYVVDESQRLMKDKGLVVVLDDPVAILQEISAYIGKRWDNFLAEADTGDPKAPKDTWGRKHSLCAALDTLRHHVEREAEAEVLGMSGIDHAQVNGAYLMAVAEAYSSSYREEYKRDTEATKAKLDEKRKERWDKYAVLYDHNQRTDFEKRFKTATKKHDDEYTTPLACAHAAWLCGDGLKSVLNHHFDMADLDSGLAYQGVALACISGTGALGACRKVYDDWFNQPIRESPLWRALLMNYSQFLDAVDKASAGPHEQYASIDNWSNLISLWNTATSKIQQYNLSPKNPQVLIDKVRQVDLLPALLQEMGDLPIVRLLKGGKVGKALLATLGMHSGKPVRWVQMVGTRRDLYSKMISICLESQKKGVNLNTLKYPIEDQLKAFELEGVNMDEQMKTWTVTFDTDAQEKLVKQRLHENPGGEALSKTAKVISVKDLKPTVIDYVTHPGVLGGVGLMLSLVALHNTNSVDSTIKNLQERARFKIFALYSATTGNLLDMTRGGAMAVKGTRIPMLGSWLAEVLSTRKLAVWQGAGAMVSGASLLILGGIDVANTVEAYSRNQKGLAILYGIDAVAEGGAGVYSLAAGLGLIMGWDIAFLSLSTFNPIIFGFTVAILLTSYAIEKSKDPPTMDWVRQSLWGKGKEAHAYLCEGEEIVNFHKAMEAEMASNS